VSFTTGGGGGNDLNKDSRTFGNQPALTEMFRSLIRKAYVDPNRGSSAPAQTGAIIINLDNSIRPLFAGMCGIPQIPPGGWQIVGVHLAAGTWNPTSLRLQPISCTATIDLRLASLGTWGAAGGVPLSPSPIQLLNQAEVDIDITGWITSLQPGDQLIYSLSQFIGNATCITMTIAMKRIDLIDVGNPPLVDADGDGFTDSNGDPFTVRE